MHPIRLPIAAVLCLALAPTFARATTMFALSTETLYEKADVVAVIDVQKVHAEYAERLIVTHVNARVARAFKGSAVGDSFKILTDGGTYGKWQQHTAGAAEFTEGETCVVFLRKVTEGVYDVVGMEQGKLVIEPGSSGAFVVRRTNTARLVQRSAAGLVDAAALPRTEPMDAYLATLRRLSGAK